MTNRHQLPQIVAIELLGGLGNQIFQYASAKAIASRIGAELVLDVRPFDAYSLRKYELDRFRISNRLASEQDLKLFERTQFSQNRVVRKLQKTFALLSKPQGICYREKSGPFVYDPGTTELKAPLLLRGYWQSEKYFSSIRVELLKELQLKDTLNRRSQEILSQIEKSSVPVSLHVRRGDYVSNPEAARFHGQCSMRYYRNAIQWANQYLGTCEFFIFSDDIKWCRSNLDTGLSSAIYVDANPPSNPEADLILMKACAHHIIANSSFSWWGAWLCTNPEQKVIAPQHWLADPNVRTDDIVPERWIRLEN